jgi:hypothetical protein
MPAHKLVLLCKNIRPKYLDILNLLGKRVGGYSRYLDLRELEESLPVRLYCGGIHNGINKLQFDDEIAQLGLTKTREIVKAIFGSRHEIMISRVDWCLDIPGISVVDLALYCRVARSQTFVLHRSRGSLSVYPRRSKAFTILFYDWVAKRRAIHHPLARFYGPNDHVTRIEVQLRGRGLTFRDFNEIEEYAELQFLSNLSFWELGCKKKGLTPIQDLAAEGFLHRIEQYGVAGTSKFYSPQVFAGLRKKFLIPANEFPIPDLDYLMQMSTRVWLQDRIRFPRLREPKGQ